MKTIFGDITSLILIGIGFVLVVTGDIQMAIYCAVVGYGNAIVWNLGERK